MKTTYAVYDPLEGTHTEYEDVESCKLAIVKLAEKLLMHYTHGKPCQRIDRDDNGVEKLTDTNNVTIAVSDLITYIGLRVDDNNLIPLVKLGSTDNG